MSRRSASSTVVPVGSTSSADGLPFADGQYSYIWKTDKDWAGTCRELRVLLVDGTLHTARFKFK